MPSPTPAYDNKIYQKYSKKSLSNKEKNKIAFCQDFDLKYNKKTPLLCLSSPLTDANNINLLQGVMEGVLEQEVQVAIVGVGTQKYQDFFTGLTKKYHQKITIISDNDANKRKLYAASDMFLCTCKKAECLEEMKIAMSYGVVPIAPSSEYLVDYDGSKEQGNAFVYQEGSPWRFFAALIRAFENFKFPYDWKVIQKNAMDHEGGEEDEEESNE